MIYSIQYMRAIAACMVVMHHIAWKGMQYSNNPLHWYTVGEAGVDLFFIISGYIMSHTINNKNITMVQFLLARVSRIIPLYWLLTSFALVVYVLMPSHVNSSGGDTKILESYLLLPVDGKYLIQNGWTLSYEFYFYIIFSVSLSVKNKLGFVFPFVILLLLGLLGGVNEFDLYQFRFMTNPILIEFVFGMLIYRLMSNNRFNNLKVSFLMLLAVLSIFICINFYQFDCSRVLKYGLPCAAFFCVMLTLENFFYLNRERLLSSIFQKIGDSSFSLYLFHPFSLVLTSILSVKMKFNGTGFVFVLVSILSALFTGWCCYVLLEKKLSRYLMLMRSHSLNISSYKNS